MNEILYYWSEFRALPYSDMVLMAGGAIIGIFAILRIVQNSLKMLLWVLLAGLGLSAWAHGAHRAPWSERPITDVELAELYERGSGGLRAALEALCWKLDDSVAFLD